MHDLRSSGVPAVDLLNKLNTLILVLARGFFLFGHFYQSFIPYIQCLIFGKGAGGL